MQKFILQHFELIMTIMVLIMLLLVWLPQIKRKYKSNNTIKDTIKNTLKQVDKCEHEWEEWGSGGTNDNSDKVFCCKKCGVIGFYKD